MKIFEQKFIPNMQDKEKELAGNKHDSCLLYNVMTETNKNWGQGEVKQIVNYIAEQCK